MTQHHDKNDKPIHVGDLVHFTMDGHPYSGVVHSLVRRDHKNAVTTIVQLFLPAAEVSRDPPKTTEAEAPSAPPTPLPTPKKGPR